MTAHCSNGSKERIFLSHCQSISNYASKKVCTCKMFSFKVISFWTEMLLFTKFKYTFLRLVSRINYGCLLFSRSRITFDFFNSLKIPRENVLDPVQLCPICRVCKKMCYFDKWQYFISKPSFHQISFAYCELKFMTDIRETACCSVWH